LRALQGLGQLDEEPESALAAEAFSSPEGRRQFLRGKLVKHEGGEHSVIRVALASGSGSHLMGGLAHADCLIVVPENVTRVEIGEPVRILRLETA
jgi:molybdopterin molybdotransferase